MGAKEIREFLTWLAVERNVAAATQNQALNALVFLYDKVLGIPVGDISGTTRAKRPPRLPVVLTHEEAMRLIAELAPPYDLMASLMYGAGLRVVEFKRMFSARALPAFPVRWAEFGQLSTLPPRRTLVTVRSA
jgi:integrase